jgi:hypothetical protein
MVYKYLHPDRIDVLENGLIRFTQPDLLNDIFEALPDYSGLSTKTRNYHVEQARSLGLRLTENDFQKLLATGPMQARHLCGQLVLFAKPIKDRGQSPYVGTLCGR